MRNRVFQWLAFLYGVTGELYAGVNRCWSEPCGDGTRDPWVSVRASGGHGDGTLVYPGLPARIGGATPTVVSSMRLELIRDGMEDYEYLRALEAQGDGAFARAKARSFITSAYSFDDDPARLSAARRAMGERLSQRALAARR